MQTRGQRWAPKPTSHLNNAKERACNAYDLYLIAGPVYYKGWYHLFYQYNPDAAVWGNKIAWGHAASRDLVHWRHLPLAMVPDHWYDTNGVWTSSATTLPDGRLAMLYTGSTNASVQVQCLAVPADDADPLLTNWTKYERNPVLYPPRGIGPRDFRDPTTAWLDPSDGAWRIVIGSKDDDDDHHAGIAVVYRSRDLVHFDLLPSLLHRVAGTGMWECCWTLSLKKERSHPRKQRTLRGRR
jgi:sucrose-6-phosphate hydrolase SacC (GH32 family)